jgi:peptide/nickel transport system permease protein
VVRRVLLTIPVVFAMSVFVFLMIRLVPGDPVRTMLGFRATDENVAVVRPSSGSISPSPRSTSPGSAA